MHTSPRRRAFVIFWIAQTVSLGGLQISGLGLPLTALTALSADTRTLAVLSAAGTAPWIIFGLAVGTVVDRFPRRLLIMISHLGRTAVLATIPVCWLFGVLSVTQLIMVAGAVGILAMIFETAYHAYLPYLVPAAELSAANRRLAITDGAARASGPAAAGAVIQSVGAPLSMIIPAACHLFCGAATAVLPATPATSRRPRAADLLEGARLVWRDRRLRRLVGQEMAFGFGFAVASAALLVSYADAGLSSSMIGLVIGIGAVAGIAGSVGSARIGTLLGTEAMMRLGLVLRAVGLGALPLLFGLEIAPVVVAAGCRAAMSAGWSLWDIPRLTIMQSAATDDLGKINGTALFAVRTAELLGSSTAAALAAALAPPAVIMVGATVATVAAIGYLLRRR
ncbi:MFS transporter [Microlunatus soli]|uniref:Transmembrane secretion effector n=1 Tax=Microlunatus soli TaxID=630515 RepID=A0A1H1ZN63_9ACTN|nr:MFS transporter [Microlunatus soli]SDT35255.1 Transmembrane secretion effector [Microlunatus soli]